MFTGLALSRVKGSAWSVVYRLMGTAGVLWLMTDLLDTAWGFGFWDVSLGTPVDLIWALPYAPMVVAARLGHRKAIWESAVRLEEREETIGRPVLVYAFLLLLMHIVLEASGILGSELSRLRSLTVVVTGLALAVLTVLYDRALARENVALLQARKAGGVWPDSGAGVWLAGRSRSRSGNPDRALDLKEPCPRGIVRSRS